MRISRGKNGMLTYHYQAGGCMDFALHLLCEVGAPYQPAARARRADLERQGYRLAWAHGDKLGDYRTVQGAKCAITRAHKAWLRANGYCGARGHA